MWCGTASPAIPLSLSRSSIPPRCACHRSQLIQVVLIVWCVDSATLISASGGRSGGGWAWGRCLRLVFMACLWSGWSGAHVHRQVQGDSASSSAAAPRSLTTVHSYPTVRFRRDRADFVSMVADATPRPLRVTDTGDAVPVQVISVLVRTLPAAFGAATSTLTVLPNRRVTVSKIASATSP